MQRRAARYTAGSTTSFYSWVRNKEVNATALFWRTQKGGGKNGNSLQKENHRVRMKGRREAGSERKGQRPINKRKWGKEKMTE